MGTAVTVVLTLVFGLSFLVFVHRRSSVPEPSAAPGASSSPTVSPADKSTIQPPPSETPDTSWTKTWPTGVLAHFPPPMSEVDFMPNNGWAGYLGDQRIVIAAGIPGYDHPKDGALFIATLRPEGGFDTTSWKVVDGVGAFTVVSGKDNAGVHVRSENGQTFYYDLRDQTLTRTG